MRRFYDKHIDPSNKEFILSEEESKHVVRVLRMSIGDKLEMVNGKGQLFECTIITDQPKKCTLQVDHCRSAEQETALHIAVSPTKQMDRIEWFIEKATEIGVTEFSFIACSNSERTQLKTERLMKKAVAAMKQSKRLFLPKINEMESFEKFITHHNEGALCHCFEGEKLSLSDAQLKDGAPILIGPEGDFTEEEIALAQSKNYKFITLGENRLRTETAALYVAAIQKFLAE